MRNEFLYGLTASRPCRLIKQRELPYLERYYMGQLFGVTFYLHRFVSDGSEEQLHNHPWRHGFALILSGHYVEESLVDICPVAGASGCRTRFDERYWFNRVDANTFHRIHRAKPGTWTLFVHGGRDMINDMPKGWGFLKRLTLANSPHHVDATLFTPYAPTGDGDEMNWWENAPLGRDVGREPLQ